MSTQTMTIAPSELILGGQKSGKSRRAELLARQWLDQNPAHRAVLIATAQPWDEEMRQRIARHQSDRLQRVPGMRTVEEPVHLAQAITQHSRADTLVVVDCLTLWLTNMLMPKEAVTPVERAQAAPVLIARSSREARAFTVNSTTATRSEVDAHADTPEVEIEVRAFAAPIGVNEDPVTGSFNAALAQWLIADEHAPAQYVASQGGCIGRAGRVHITQDPTGQVWVGGDCVTCVDGNVAL